MSRLLAACIPLGRPTIQYGFRATHRVDCAQAFRAELASDYKYCGRNVRSTRARVR